MSSLQVLQDNKCEGRPHGDAEGETCDQPRDALAVHLTSPLMSGLLVKDTLANG